MQIVSEPGQQVCSERAMSNTAPECLPPVLPSRLRLFPIRVNLQAYLAVTSSGTQKLSRDPWDPVLIGSDPELRDLSIHQPRAGGGRRAAE